MATDSGSINAPNGDATVIVVSEFPSESNTEKHPWIPSGMKEVIKDWAEGVWVYSIAYASLRSLVGFIKWYTNE